MTDLRVLKTRKTIQDAFVDLVLSEGFERITVSELAKRAIINRQTFYKHYLDKYDLAKKMAENILGLVKGLAQQRVDLLHQDLTAIQIVDQIRPPFIEFVQQYRRQILALRQVHLSDFDMDQQIMVLVKQAANQILGNTGSPFEIAILSGVVNSVLNYLLEYNDLPTDEEIAEALTRIKEFIK